MSRTNGDPVAEALARIDLNLLVALDVLLQERNVTRSARRLGITQSAMSQTLQRLRGLLEDPLLVRRGAEMVATPRAEELAGPLHAALRTLERTLIEPLTFDPARSNRVFRVALLDVHSVTVLPRLLQRVQRAGATAATGVVIDVVPVEMDLLVEQLRRGDVDVALVMPRDARVDIEREVVLEESLVALVRAGHPLLRRGAPSAEAFLAYPHATFRITGRGASAVDEQIQRRGGSRYVALRVPYFLAAPALVASCDLVAMVPRSFALTVQGSDRVVVLPAPLEPERYPMEMVWSRHLDADAGHLWLREQMRDVTREVQEQSAAMRLG